MSVSANPDPSAFVLEPSIELKKRIGARKKVQKKKQTKSDTFQKPLESLSGNFKSLFIYLYLLFQWRLAFS